MRPRLRSYVYFSPVEEGVVFRTWAGTFVLHGRGLYDVLERLAPKLDGARTVEEICAGMPPGSAQKVAILLAKLIERGVVADETALTDAPLSDDERALYAASLAYLDLYLRDPAPAFLRFRSSRLLLLGDGWPVRAAARALMSLGLRTLSVLLTDGEETQSAIEADFRRHQARDARAELRIAPAGSEASDLPAGEFDLVAHAAADGTSDRFRALEEASRRADVRLLQATVLNGYGVVTPVCGKDAPLCWACVENRLIPSASTPSATLGLLVGNALAFDAFRLVAGSLPLADRQKLLTIDADTLEMERRALVPLATCQHARSARLAPDALLDELRSFASDTDAATLLTGVESLLDPVVGVIPQATAGDLEQVPLCLVSGEYRLSDGRRGTHIAPGDTALEARYQVVRACLESIAMAELSDEIPQRVSLRTGRAATVATTCQMTASGHSFAEWVGRGLLGALRERGTESPWVDVSSSVTTAEPRHWLRVLRLRYQLDARVGLRRLGALAASEAVVAVEGAQIAAAVGRTAGEAILAALRQAVAMVQLRGVDARQPEGESRQGQSARVHLIEGESEIAAEELDGAPAWQEWADAAIDALNERCEEVFVEPWQGAEEVRRAGLLVGRVAVGSTRAV